MKKKIYLLFFALLAMISTRTLAQVSAYTFAEGTETYAAVGGTNITATGDDGSQNALPIGFTFKYGGADYTTFSANTNGWIRLGANMPTSSTWDNTIFGGSATTHKPLIAAFWDDNNRGTGAISYALTGTAPNQVLEVGWNNVNIGGGGSTSATNFASFKLRLYETTNVVEFVYGGTMAAAGTLTASIGLNDNTSYLSVTPGATATTSSTATNNAISATTDVVGKKYTFTPPFVSSELMDYVNLQHPASATITVGGSEMIYAQGWEPGITEAPGPGAGVQAWIGYSTSNTNPSTWTNWVPATFNVQAGNNDEFMASIGSTLPIGVYYYASRWKLGSGVYSYGGYNAGGGDGFWDGTNDVSGILTVVCAAQNVPYTENFTSVTAPALGACMIAQNVNNDANTWRTYSSITGITGFTYPVAGYQYNSTNNANDWLYTKGLNLTGGTTYRLTFLYNNDGTVPADAPDYYPEKLKVMYGSNPTAAAMTNLLADYPEVASATPQTAVIDFTPASTGVYYIGFQAYSDADQDFLLIDDISVDVKPACDVPVGLATTVVGATNATVTWTGTGTFILEYGPAGYTPGTGATAGSGSSQVITNAVSPQNIGGLTAGTTYDVYIRKDCTAGANGYSANSTKLTFQTSLDCSAATVITACGVDQVAAIAAGTGVYASTECGFSTPGRELLYSFTPATTAQYVLNVSAVNAPGYIDYLIKEASDGCANSGWECIDDVNSTGNVATLNLVGGTTYLFLLDAESSTAAPSQTFSLVCPPTAPANDAAPGAITLTVGAGCSAAPYTNAGASQAADEKYASCFQSAATGTGITVATHTVWFKFVATNAAVKVTTDITGGTLTDTHLALYSATDANNYSTFNIVSCDDDGGVTANFRSTLYATGLSVGQTYYISVDGYNGGTGTFCVSVDDLASSMLATSNTCSSSYQTPSGTQATYTGQVPLLDAAGNLVAIVRNPAGGAVNAYTVGQNINTGAVRQSVETNNYYLDRNFRIANASATNVEVQFFFLASELAALNAANGTTLSTLAASKQREAVAGCYNNYVGTNGGLTLLPQTANGTSADGNVNWIQVTTPSFSNFYLNNVGQLLPITIEYFRGTKQNSKNVLDWKVSCYNSPTVRLTLERSLDGRKYDAISTTTETSLRCLQPFNYNDQSPFAGINYYRLKAMDIDGKVSYSNVVALLNKDKGFEIVSLAPNPVKDEAILNVTSAEKTIMEIVVSDLSGKQISKQRLSLIAGSNQVPLNFRNVAAGTYQVTGLTADGQMKSLRFVKQ